MPFFVCNQGSGGGLQGGSIRNYLLNFHEGRTPLKKKGRTKKIHSRKGGEKQLTLGVINRTLKSGEWQHTHTIPPRCRKICKEMMISGHWSLVEEGTIRFEDGVAGKKKTFLLSCLIPPPPPPLSSFYFLSCSTSKRDDAPSVEVLFFF